MCRGDSADLVQRPLRAGATYTPSSVYKELRAGGVRVLPTQLPTIYNDANGMHSELLPKLLKLAASPDTFIKQAVNLAVAEDLDGWNVDFEIGAADWNSTVTTVPLGAQLLAKFLDTFAQALHAKGKLLSVDMSTDTNPLCLSISGRAPVLKHGCNYEWWPVYALNRTSVDRFITMTTYESFERFVVGAGAMVSGFWRRTDGGNYAPTSPRRVGMGFASTRPMNTTELERRFSVVEQLGIEEIDIWSVDEVQQVPEIWLPLLRAYVAGEPLPRARRHPTAVNGATPRRTAMAWMGSSGRTDAQLNASIAYFAANRDALTTASPTSHCLGMDGSLQERPLAHGAVCGTHRAPCPGSCARRACV